MKFKFLQLKFFLRLIGRWKGWQANLFTGFLIILVAASCEVDDFSEDIVTGEANSVPSIEVLHPTDTGKAVFNNIEGFEQMVFTAKVADATPGLSTLTYLVTHKESGELILDTLLNLVGTTDSATFRIKAERFTFGEEYSMEVEVRDTEGFPSMISRDFVAISSQLQSVQEQMFILGSLNGWGGTDLQMTLVDDYTWAYYGLSITAADEFKFVNTPDFSDVDWGDGECDDQTEQGGSNIACGFDGFVTVLFNDLTLEYSLLPADANNTEMFILGSLNGWGGTDLQMTFAGDNTWVRNGILFGASDEFKFANTSDFSGTDWGDGDCDGTAETPGDNIACGFEGFYNVTFNDETLAYTTKQVLANQTEMYVLGSMNGWGGTDNEMSLVEDNLWVAENVTLVGTDEFKFANTSDFSDVDWGDAGCDGTAETPGDNIACGFDGTFTITFNDVDLSYTVN